MSTAQELREQAEKYGYTKYNPKPEAIEVVETMFNNCHLEKVDENHTRITIRGLSCVILYPYDEIESKPKMVDLLLFYHRSVTTAYDPTDKYDCWRSETEKSLRKEGAKFVDKYLDKYHSDYYDRYMLYSDYYDR